MKPLRSLLPVLILLLAPPAHALPLAPNAVNHQGLLLDSAGQPMNGAVNLTVRIWRAATGIGTALFIYEEQHPATPVLDGVYSISIGAGTGAVGSFAANGFAEPDRWLEIAVNGETLTPRQRFTSVPYALSADRAESLGGLTASQIIDAARASLPFANLSGEIDEAQVPTAFTRDAEVAAIALGAGFSNLGPAIEAAEIDRTGLDADLLDGLDSSAFVRALPVTRRILVPGNTFIPASSDTVWLTGFDGYGYTNVAPYNATVRAPLVLPVGATLTSFSCSRYVGVAGHTVGGSASLRTRIGASPVSTQVAILQLFLTSTVATVLPNTTGVPGQHVVAEQPYWIHVDWSQGADDGAHSRRFYGCDVTLTLPQPD